MRLIVDTNVVLDVLLPRPKFFPASADVFSRIERGEHAGYVCATTVTTIHYLVARTLAREAADEAVRTLLSLFSVAPVTRAVLDAAIAAGFPDFEDAVIHEAARHAAADAIVTRDASGFLKASLPVHRPADLIRMLDAASDRR